METFQSHYFFSVFFSIWKFAAQFKRKSFGFEVLRTLNLSITSAKKILFIQFFNGFFLPVTTEPSDLRHILFFVFFCEMKICETQWLREFFAFRSGQKKNCNVFESPTSINYATTDRLTFFWNNFWKLYDWTTKFDDLIEINGILGMPSIHVY